jgi:hypothetical protein
LVSVSVLPLSEMAAAALETTSCPIVKSRPKVVEKFPVAAEPNRTSLPEAGTPGSQLAGLVQEESAAPDQALSLPLAHQGRTTTKFDGVTLSA